MANRKVAATSIVLTVSLAAVLMGCSLNKSEVSYNDGIVTSGISEVATGISQEATSLSAEFSKANLTEEEADIIVKEYFTDLKSDMTPYWDAFLENGEDGLDELIVMLKGAITSTYDFTHGYTDINGIYFEDLSDSGKVFVDETMNLFNHMAVMVNPDYKAWFADKSEDFKNFIGEENTMALKDIKDGALTIGGNMLESLDNKWKEFADSYKKER